MEAHRHFGWKGWKVMCTSYMGRVGEERGREEAGEGGGGKPPAGLMGSTVPPRPVGSETQSGRYKPDHQHNHHGTRSGAFVYTHESVVIIGIAIGIGVFRLCQQDSIGRYWARPAQPSRDRRWGLLSVHMMRWTRMLMDMMLVIDYVCPYHGWW